MDIYKNLKKACRIRKMTMVEVGKRAGLGKNSWQNWKDHIPTLENILEVAKALNTSVEYLAGEVDDIDALEWDNYRQSLSNKEREMIELYRGLNDAGQEACFSALTGFLGNAAFRKEEPMKEMA